MAITRYNRDNLFEQLAARWDGTPFWTEADATDALNDALSLYNLLTGYWNTTAALLTVANAYKYTLPAALTYGMRVAWNGLPLTSTGLFDLDNGRPAWRTETTLTGGAVPTRPTLWAPTSLQTIVVWPADTVANNTFTCDGVAATPVLTTANTKVDLDEAGLGLIVGCALHLTSFSQGSERFAATQPLFAAFLAGAAERNSALEASAWYRRYLGLDRQRDFRPTTHDKATAGLVLPQ